ncbi:MAG TPA: flagellar basal-body MS-ring/collar protein FliF [Solirubrobacter sp.]|nr:flagellar basal-body MS-ring/collar protein FliF [Solirubrobacter sp.]
MPPFIQNLLALPPKTKALLGVSAVAILAIAFLMLKIATAPSYAQIASGLDPAETGKITEALDAQGIAYELRNNGTALAVQKSQSAQARIALAGAGVQTSGGTQPGYELLDESKLGASQFQQQAAYQRALEGEVARTLANVEGVQNPVVRLVLPQDDLFQDEATAATAAVMLGNPADTLQPGAVRGMAQVVASSVKGLKSENVTITDSSGQVLWPSDEAGGNAGPGGSSKQSAEARYARSLESSLNAMLAATLGPNKAQVKVNADLNVDKTTEKELTHAARGVPVETSRETERLRGGAANAGGAAGTAGNVPTYSAGNAGNGGNSNYNRTKTETKNAIDKKIKTTEVAPGAVNKLNVALMVDKSVPAEVFKSLEQTVATAAGIDTARGDTITPMQMAFAKPEVPKAGPVPTTLLGPLKWVGLGLASLLFLFFMVRGMRKREGADLGTPAWLTEIEEPVSLAQLEARTNGYGLENASSAMLPPRVPDASLHQLDQLMEREPERVAAQVKAWMAEE